MAITLSILRAGLRARGSAFGPAALGEVATKIALLTYYACFQLLFMREVIREKEVVRRGVGWRSKMQDKLQR